MKSSRRFAFVSATLFLAAALVIATGGCSKPRPDGMPKLTKCSITLKYADGTPAQDVTITLFPVGGALSKWPSAGKTDASGEAQIVTYGEFPGAPYGEYKVVLNKMEIVGEVNDGVSAQTEPIEYYSLVELDYTSADTTPLTLTVGDKKVSETFEIGSEARELIDRIESGGGM